MPTIAAYDAILFIEHLMPLPMMAHVEMNLEEKILNATYDAILVNWALDIYDAQFQTAGREEKGLAFSTAYDLYYCYLWI